MTLAISPRAADLTARRPIRGAGGTNYDRSNLLLRCRELRNGLRDLTDDSLFAVKFAIIGVTSHPTTIVSIGGGGAVAATAGSCVIGDTRDHIPSRSLLDQPYPENLPVIGSCQVCNQGFSKDEEYVVCLIEAALAGSTDPDKIWARRLRGTRLPGEKPGRAAGPSIDFGFRDQIRAVA